MIPFHLFPPPTPEQKRWQREAHEREVAARLPSAVPWSPDIKFAPKLTIQAATYKARSLFDVPHCGHNINKTTAEQRAESPSGAFVYCEKRVPRGAKLTTLYASQKGDVMFDGDIIVPALHERNAYTQVYEHLPWMSITPMEMLTLRGGTKRAKGHTIVAGLGLGHQLVEVSKRRQVTRLTLVERSRELVDWLLPRIQPHLGQPIEVVIGDAYEVMPAMTADVALVDIFRDYGGNDYLRDRLRRSCPKIGFIWGWGTSSPR